MLNFKFDVLFAVSPMLVIDYVVVLYYFCGRMLSVRRLQRTRRST